MGAIYWVDVVKWTNHIINALKSTPGRHHVREHSWTMWCGGTMGDLGVDSSHIPHFNLLPLNVSVANSQERKSW